MTRPSTPSLQATLRDHCGPFLAQQGPELPLLYRGVTGASTGWSVREVRAGRIPKNMPPALHEAADAWFLRQFGVRYRSHALFCTPDRAQAEQHGTVHAIVPCGEYSLCWSPVVVDLHQWVVSHGLLDCPAHELPVSLARLDYREQVVLDTPHAIVALESVSTEEFECETACSDECSSPPAQQRLSGHAWPPRVEVMLHCSRYVAVPLPDRESERTLRDLLHRLTRLAQ